MGHANRGHHEHGILSVADISHVGTKEIVGEERGEERLRHVSKIHRSLRKISRFRRRSLTVNKINLSIITNIILINSGKLCKFMLIFFHSILKGTLLINHSLRF